MDKSVINVGIAVLKPFWPIVVILLYCY